MALDFRIINENYAVSDATTITASSSDISFPSSNLGDVSRGKVWRSSGSFVIDSTNNKLNFKDTSGGSELTATITSGTYTASTLCTEIDTQMEAVGAQNYTVSWSQTTGRFTFISDGSDLRLLWFTGTNAANSVGATLGFIVSSDDVGATTHTGDYVSIHTEETVVFDLGSALDVDSVVLLFDSLDGCTLTDNAVVTIQANASNSWGSPSYSQVMTLDSVFDVYSLFLVSAQTYRYWRLKIVDPKNPLLFVEVAKVVFGEASSFTSAPNIGFSYTHDDQSRITENDFGHSIVDIYPIRKTLKVDFTALPEADIDLIQQIYLSNGTHTPVLVALDTQAGLFDKDRFLIYGRIVGELGLKHVFNEYFDFDLEFREVM